MRLDPIAALKRRAQRKRSEALAKERALFCGALNDSQGGDWYYDPKDDIYRDYLAARTCRDCGEAS